MKGWLKLCGIALALWFFFAVFTPFWVSFSPAHQTLYDAHEEHNLPTGGLFYTDLDFISDAAMMLFDTWRFLPRKEAAPSEPLTKESAFKKLEPKASAQ